MNLEMAFAEMKALRSAEDRTTFYKRHASLAADHIDEIKVQVRHLVQLGRPIPSDVRELGKLAATASRRRQEIKVPVVP